MTLIPLGEAVTLHFSLPFFVILVAILILCERVGVHCWVVMVIGFAGVCILLRPGVQSIHPGMMAAISAAAASGLSDVLLRTLLRTGLTPSIWLYDFALQLPYSLAPALNEWVTPSGAEWGGLFLMACLAFRAQWSLSRF